MNHSVAVTLGASIPTLPFVALGIIGLILSFTRRARFPRGASWAAFGFASLVLNAVISLVQEYNAAASAFDGAPANDVHMLFWTTSAMYLLRLAGMIALAAAVFAERSPVQPISSGG